MLTVKALQDAQQELFDRAAAIVAIATEEKRELTAEETTEIDGINGVGEKAGKIDEIQVKLDRCLKIEAVQKRLATERALGALALIPNDRLRSVETTLDQFIIPARHKSHGNLKAFKGPNAEREAYVAGQFYAAALYGREDSREWLADNGMPITNGRGDVMNSMGTGTNTGGGFTVPETLDGNLIRLVSEYGVARRECQIYPMGPGRTLIPRRDSGFTSYWLGDNTAITASDLVFSQIALEANKLCVLSQISSELYEDSIVALGDLLTMEAALSFATAEDQALFIGDGTQTYGGIIGLKNVLLAGAKQTAGAGLDTFAEIVIGEFQGAVAKLAKIPGIQPKWFMHPAAFNLTAERLALAAGGNTTTNYNNAMGPTFLGYPVVFSNVLESSAGDISDLIYAYFGDMRMTAILGTRRGVTFATDSSYYFNQDAIAFRATERVDINVHEIGTASVAGTMVALVAGS